jgi:hypothetical protein
MQRSGVILNFYVIKPIFEEKKYPTSRHGQQSSSGLPDTTTVASREGEEGG